MQDIIIARHELAIASNISNTIHCIHKSNIKLLELGAYSQHIVVTYVSLSTFLLVSYIASYLAIHFLHSLMLNKYT